MRHGERGSSTVSARCRPQPKLRSAGASLARIHRASHGGIVIHTSSEGKSHEACSHMKRAQMQGKVGTGRVHAARILFISSTSCLRLGSPTAAISPSK